LSTERERTGIRTGANAINPMNGQPVPIYIADYVLMGYTAPGRSWLARARTSGLRFRHRTAACRSR